MLRENNLCGTLCHSVVNQTQKHYNNERKQYKESTAAWFRCLEDR